MKTSLKIITLIILLLTALNLCSDASDGYSVRYTFDDGTAVSVADGSEYETAELTAEYFSKFDLAFVSTLKNLPYDKSANLRFNLAYGDIDTRGWNNSERVIGETTVQFEAAAEGDYDYFELVGRPAFVSITDGEADYSAQIKGYRSYLTYRDGSFYCEGEELTIHPHMTGFNVFAMTLHPDKLTFDLYINNRLVKSGISLSAGHTDGDKYKFVGFSWLSVRNVYEVKTDSTLKLRRGSFGIDNLCVYSGAYRADESLLCFKQTFDNPDTAYGGLGFTEKTSPDGLITNTVTVENDEAHNRGGYLAMRINYPSQDCMADISISEQYGSQLVIQQDFMIEKNGVDNQLFFLRDSTSGSKNTDLYVVRVRYTGYFYTNGKNIKNVNDGKWHNTAVAFDLKNRVYSVYLDGIAVAVDIPVSESFLTLNMFRVRLGPVGDNTGSLLTDNMYIYRGIQPRTVSEDEEVDRALINTSTLLRTDDYSKTRLSGKGAVNQFAQTYWSKSKKFTDKRIFADGDTAYVPADVFEKICLRDISTDGDLITVGSTTFQKNSRRYIKDGAEGIMPKGVIVREGETYFPVVEAVSVIDGLYVKDDLHGIILIDESEITYSDFVLKELGNYMFYDRQTIEDMQSHVANISGHPRLLATADDFDRVRVLINENEFVREMYDSNISTADAILTQSPVEYALDNRSTILGLSSSVRSRAMYLGFAWQMTGDRKYVDRALEEVRAAAAFPDWNAYYHFLDPSEMCMGFALVYDWMYDALTDDEKALIRKAMIDFAIMPAYNIYTNNSSYSNWWATTNLNWNGVCNGGIGCGALAIADEEPALAAEVMYHVLRLIEYAWYQIAPDGAWDEGPGYWGYYLQYFSYLMTSAEASFGTDFGIWRYRGADKLGFFPRVISSDEGSYNFHDSGSGFSSQPVMYYMSRKLGINSLTSQRTYDITNRGALISAADLLWYDPSMDSGYIDYSTDNYMREADIVTMRESWSDPDSMFAAYHGGAVTGAHMHYDTGSFIYDVNGERWAMELGSDNYYYYTLYGDDNIYRKRSEGHNIFTINPSEHPGQEGSYGYITRFETNGNQAISTVDLSECYQSYASKAVRGLKTEDNKRSLVIQDEIEMSGEYPAYWFIHTSADVTKVSDNKFIFKRNGKKLAVLIDTDLEEYTTGIMEAKPLETSPPLYNQNPNTGISKIYLKADISGTVRVTMKLCPIGEGLDENNIDILPIDEWTISAVDESFGNYVSGASSVETGLFGKPGNDTALVTAAETVSGTFMDIALGDTIVFGADVAPMGSEAVLTAGGTDDAQAQPFDLAELARFGSDGSLRVLGKEIFAAGEPFAEDKWYRLDIVVTTGSSFDVYIDGQLAAGDVPVDFAPDRLDYIALSSDGKSAFDNITAGADRGGYIPLTLIHGDRGYNNMLSVGKGINIFETDEYPLDSSAVRNLGIMGGTVDRSIVSGDTGTNYLHILTSNGSDLYIPIRRVGELLSESVGQTDIDLPDAKSGKMPFTAVMTLTPEKAFTVSCGDTLLFDSSTVEEFKYNRSQELAFVLLPASKTVFAYLGGTKISETSYTPSVSVLTVSGAVADSCYVHTGCYGNRQYVTEPMIISSDDGLSAVFSGGSVIPRDVIFAAIPGDMAESIALEKTTLGDMSKYSIKINGENVKTMLIDAKNLMPLVKGHMHE